MAAAAWTCAWCCRGTRGHTRDTQLKELLLLPDRRCSSCAERHRRAPPGLRSVQAGPFAHARHSCVSGE